MSGQKIRASRIGPPRWFGPLWLGAGVLALTALTRLLFDVPNRPGWLDGFILGATIFGYTVLQPARLLRIAAGLAGALAGFCFLQLDWTLQLAAVVPASLWILYYGPVAAGVAARFRQVGSLHKSLSVINLRERPIAKPLTIALTWAWVTVLLPLPVYAWLAALPLVVGRSCFIFALALAYDLVDVDDDRRRKLPTLALQLGYQPSLGLIGAALAASAACVSLNFWRQIYTFPATVALLVSLTLSAAVLFPLLRSKLAGGWKKIAIDSLMILPWLLQMLNDEL